MAFCRKCGNEILDEAFVCPNCGVKTGFDEEPEVQEEVAVSSRPSAKAIVGFIFSLSSFTSCWLGFLSPVVAICYLVFSIIGLSLSNKGMNEIQASNGTIGAAGLAKAGKVFGVISLIISIFFTILAFMLVGAMAGY